MSDVKAACFAEARRMYVVGDDGKTRIKFRATAEEGINAIS